MRREVTGNDLLSSDVDGPRVASMNCSRTQPCCYPNNDINSAANITTPDACCILCENTPGCVGWTLNMAADSKHGIRGCFLGTKWRPQMQRKCI